VINIWALLTLVVSSEPGGGCPGWRHVHSYTCHSHVSANKRLRG